MHYKDIRPLLASTFNKEYNTDFSFSDLTVITLTDNTMPDTSEYDTMVTLGHSIYEPVSIFYNRGNLETVIPYGVDLLIPDRSYDSVHKLLPLIMRRINFNLTVDDVVDAPVDYVDGTITVKVKPNISLCNNCTFKVNITCGSSNTADGKKIIDIKYGDLPARPDIYQKYLTSGVNATHTYGTETSIGHILTSQVDYTPIAHLLKNVVVLEVSDTTYRLDGSYTSQMALLLTAMGAVDGNNYTSTISNVGISAYNINPMYNGPTYGASAQYMSYASSTGSWSNAGIYADTGPLVEAFELVNTDYTNVLILELDNHGTTNTSADNPYRLKPSFLICHYNLGV